jgi:hypothetical protein
MAVRRAGVLGEVIIVLKSVVCGFGANTVKLINHN